MTGSEGAPPSLATAGARLGRCVVDLPDLIAAFAPGTWPRTVERSALLVGLAEARGAAATAAAHRIRLAVLGHQDDRCSAEPVPSGVVVAARHAATRARRIRALARLSDLSALVDAAVDVLGRRGPARPAPRDVAAAAVVVAVASPVRAPRVALTAASARVLERAPALPAVVLTPHVRPNLLAGLLADALPGLLASAPTRHLVGRLRSPVVIGVRVGRVGATVSISRDALRIRNGVRRHTHVVLDGGVEPILRRAASRVELEMAGLEHH